MQMHVKTHQRKSSNGLVSACSKCPYCEKQFISRSLCRVHLRDRHETVRLIKNPLRVDGEQRPASMPRLRKNSTPQVLSRDDLKYPYQIPQRSQSGPASSGSNMSLSYTLVDEDSLVSPKSESETVTKEEPMEEVNIIVKEEPLDDVGLITSSMVDTFSGEWDSSGLSSTPDSPNSPFSDEDFSSDLGFFSSSSAEDEKDEKPDVGNLVFGAVHVVKQEVGGTVPQKISPPWRSSSLQMPSDILHVNASNSGWYAQTDLVEEVEFTTPFTTFI